MPARQGPGEMIVFGFLCWGVFGAIGVVGLFCVWRGLKELFAREEVTPSGLPPADHARRVAAAISTPEELAAALLRHFAERLGTTVVAALTALV